MEISEYFTNLLEREFDGRLRIRWSPFQQQYRIEQKVARGMMWPDKPILENDEEALMIKDGYWFVMGVSPREHTKCQRCGTELEIPAFETRMITCPICKIMGRTYRISAGYFPLNDRLIKYLKSIDPEKDMGKEQVAKLRANNEALVKSQQRAMSNNIEAYGKDNFTKLAQIAQVGYTGKETWGSHHEISNERQRKGIDHGSQIIGI